MITFIVRSILLACGGGGPSLSCEADESVMLLKPQQQQILRGSLMNCDREQRPPLLLLFNTDRTDLKENVLLCYRPAALQGKQK